jgi:AcrR family transcriptional regulator
MAESSTSSSPRPRGRPRSEAARQAILEATKSLLETTTVRDLTIEAIARKAGVGKTTIYRWWSSKAAVVIDTLEAAVPHARLAECKSVTAALSEQVRLLIEQYRGPYGRIMAELIAEGQANPGLLAEFRERFLMRRRAVARDLIEHGKSIKEFDPNIDTDLVCDMIYGSIYYRLLIGHLPLDSAFAEALPKHVFGALYERDRRHSPCRRPSV